MISKCDYVLWLLEWQFQNLYYKANNDITIMDGVYYMVHKR
jgi:hypothetical protein